jgi:17beta-estradiol 17-dehydrogenase / very-long-chain 3-oxoacyl-CoA reductase
MASVRRSSFLIPSPETYASAGLRHIGYEATCTPYWVHSAIWCVASIIPESVIDWWRIGFNLNIRKRGHAKDARKKAQ